MDRKQLTNVNKQATLAGDESIALVVMYLGSGDATLEVTDTAMVFTDDESGATLPDDGTTAEGTLMFSVATVDTIAELVGVINASTNFRAYAAAALSSDDPANLLVTASQTLTKAGADIAWDHGDADKLILCIGPEADADLDSEYAMSRISKSTLNDSRDPAQAEFRRGVGRTYPYDTVARLFRYVASGGNAGGNETPTVEVYSANQDSETLLWSNVGADDTEFTETFDPPAELQSKQGERLVIALSSPVGAFDAAELTVFGAYGQPGVLVA